MFSFAVMLEFVFLKTSPDNNGLTFINAGGGFVVCYLLVSVRKQQKEKTTRAEIPVMVSLQLHLSCEDYLFKKIIK